MTQSTMAAAAGDSRQANADAAAPTYRAIRQTHWDHVARLGDRRRGWSGAYHRRLSEVYSFLVVPGQRVLEVGCARGDLLASLKPAHGVGVDFSPEMLQRARQRHPELQFVAADAHEIKNLDGPFDAIILSDLINDLWDVQEVLQRLRPLCRPSTRLILNFYSRLWEKPLALAQRMGVAAPVLPQNWLTAPDVANLLSLAGFEPLRHWEEILWPLPTPLLSSLCNKTLVKLWPFRWGAMTNFFLARPQPAPIDKPPTVSVIVPARNEAGNIAGLFDRIPDMGGGTELIFVEGHSTDATWDVIQKQAALHAHRPCKTLQQNGKGKGDAVRAGFAAATGDILMILDADVTVVPEDLPRFFRAIADGHGEFINGVRLVYPMERRAMRFMNLAGNKFFSFAFSWLLGQPIKDTLCGTKVMWRKDYEKLAANRAYFGDFDPFGDFDLLFGAARLNLKMVDLPIRYRQRTYGTTNIQRWKHGWLLLKMSAFAAGKIKFV